MDLESELNSKQKSLNDIDLKMKQMRHKMKNVMDKEIKKIEKAILASMNNLQKEPTNKSRSASAQ